MVHAWARIITCTDCLDTGCVEIAGQIDACPACTRHAERLWRARQQPAPTPEVKPNRRAFNPAKFQRRA
jgi:hypothetical protein